MVASDSPGTTTALAFAECEDAFHFFCRSAGFCEGLVSLRAVEIGGLCIFGAVRLDGWEWGGWIGSGGSVLSGYICWTGDLSLLYLHSRR